MGKMRDEWKKAKEKAEKVIPKGFFKGADLGPLLDEVEAAEKKLDKVKGTDVKGMEKAKVELAKVINKALTATSDYTKLATMGKNANAGTPLAAALDEALTALSMRIYASLTTIKTRNGIR